MTDPNKAFYKAIPASIPRTRNPISSRIARVVIHLIGWRIVGEIPDEKKLVVVIAPHTSNMDFFILVIVKFAFSLKASFIMKKEAFFWPFKRFLAGIGAIPIDRSNPALIVPQVTQEFYQRPSIWMVLAPEGTRKKVRKLKTGFVRIAHAAEVTILVVGIDFTKKAIFLTKNVRPTGDHETDAKEIFDFCRKNYVGCHPEKQ